MNFKRLVAVMLAALLCLGLIMPAQADYTAAEYCDDGMAYLKRMTPEYVKIAMEYFTSAGNYGQAMFLEKYAQALLDILTSDEDAAGLYSAQRLLERIEGNEEFAAFLAANGLPACEDLLLYVQARLLEYDGSYLEAIAYYDRVEYLLDALNRSISLGEATVDQRYEAALSLFNEGKYVEAMRGFKNLHYLDSDEKYLEALEKHEHVWLEADCEQPKICTVCGVTEGNALGHDWQEADYDHPKTCTRCGITEGDVLRREIISQRNRIAAGWYHTLALNSDGTVLADGNNESGQCNVNRWKNIVSVAAGSLHSVGLKADGTVLAIGDNSYGQCDVNNWKNIVWISAKGYATYGLKADGTVAVAGFTGIERADILALREVIAIAAGYNHLVCLKADGTTIALGNNQYGQCDVDRWMDAVSVAAGNNHTVVLLADGTAEAVGDNLYGQCNVEAWQNIVEIAAGDYCTIGLKADDTVVFTGWDPNGILSSGTQDWLGMVAVAAGLGHCVGLRADGTVAIAINTFFTTDVDGSEYRYIFGDISGWNLN